MDVGRTGEYHRENRVFPVEGVTFKWKDYRIEGAERYKTMTLATHEFIRRFLMHVLPAGFHRIRYYGMLNRSKRAANVARARELLALAPIIPIDAIKAASTKAEEPGTKADEQTTAKHPCPCCGGPMIIIETFARGYRPDYSALMLAARITLPHFSVSAAMNFPKSAGEPGRGVPPNSASRAFIFGSARASLIS
jgi:hypothetical protein